MSGGESKVSELLGTEFSPTVESVRTKLGPLNSAKGVSEKQLRVITPVLATQNAPLRPQSNVTETTPAAGAPVLEGRPTAFGPTAKATEAFEYKNANAIEDNHG